MCRAVLGVGLSVVALQVPAQVPDEVREQLVRTGVATGRGHIYASASGPLRGSPEASEQLYATRAMRSVAASLCGFEPGPGRSLEAGVTGFTMVATTLRGREVEVVVRAPVQKPECRVVAVPLQDPAVPSHPPAAEATARPLGPALSRSNEMTVRIFGGEY